MKIIKRLFLILTFTFLLCSCEYDDYNYTPTSENKIEYAHTKAEYVSDEEAMYQAIYKHLTDGSYSGEIRLYGYASTDNAFSMSNMVISEHPELFWAAVHAVSSSPEHDVIGINYHCRDFTMNDGSVGEMCAKVSEEADRIINSIPDGSSDWEKILFVHDEIVKNTWYQNGDSDKFTDTIYGCLVRGKTQSNGYAQAFKYIMDRMGYECGIFSNEGYYWNYIRLDGKYYWLDLLRDDPIFETDVPYNYTHLYFMCDAEHFSEDHDISRGNNRFAPKCDDFSKYYYVVRGSYLSGFDADAIAKLIKKNINADQLELKFDSKDAYNDAVNGFNEGKIVRNFIKEDIHTERIKLCYIDEWNVIKLLIDQSSE